MTAPREVREILGVEVGTVLKVKCKEGVSILTSRVPVKKLTETLGGMAAGIVEKSPKRVTRSAVAMRAQAGTMGD